jgi:eukaryotic-like serine/threonine-protein kinase
VAEELASRLRERFAAVVALRATPPELHEPEPLARSLARAALSLPEGATDAGAIRAACAERLGRADAEPLWAAVAYALGAIPETEPELARTMRAPGALRRALSRAIGAGLAARAEGAPLAVLVDDAHWADPSALDALEIATLADRQGALWIGVAARPSLLAQRPLWGSRAAQHRVHKLDPLADEPARALMRDLLKPIEFVPDPVIERLLQLTGGVPLYLVEVAHALRAEGRVRRRRDTGEHYLAANDFLQMSSTPLSERLARRALDRVQEPLLQILRIACVLGVEVKVGEVAAVQALAGASARGTDVEEEMDPGVGLERLAQMGVLLRSGEGRYRFRHAMLRDGVEALMPPSLRQKAHGAALHHLEAAQRRAELLPRIARHAAASGAREEAARAFLELAEEAARQHRHVDAEPLYTSALSSLDEGRTDAREQALSGRGQARAFLERYEEALLDLRQARELATARGDTRKVADLLLDEATLHDLHHDFTSSAQAAEHAAPLVGLLSKPALVARLRAAQGRTHWRSGRTNEAIEELRRGAELSAEIGDVRTQCESLLLLSTALVAGGRVEEAARRFDEVTALCERSGDRFHLAMAHINRIWLWIKLQDHERAAFDQRVALAVARELGNATLEALAAGNVAELLYYGGVYEEALPLARRMDELLRRLHPQVPAEAVFIRARIEVALGHASEALAMVEHLRSGPAEALSPFARAMVRMIELLAGDPRAEDAASWDALIGELGSCAETDEGIDALYHAARRALLSGRLDEAQRRIERGLNESRGPMWRRRFSALAERAAAG